MILAASLLALAPLQDGGFARALQLVEQGELVQALEAASEASEELERAQARVYVLIKAGDLVGAYEAATEGLASSPDDLWLRERQASIAAISLRDADLGGAAVDRLEAQVAAAELSDIDRESWTATVTSYRDEVNALVELRENQDAALTRSRSVAIGAFVVLFGLFAWLVRRPRIA